MPAWPIQFAAITVARGIDPRELALYAFGGAGPMHAAAIAQELNIRLVIIPPAPGTFSGLGFLCSDFRHDFVQTFLTRTTSPDAMRFVEIFADLEEKGTDLLRREGFSADQTAFLHSLDLRYVGQAHEVNVPIQNNRYHMPLSRVIEEFHRRHELQYGHCSVQEPVELVNCRLTALGRVRRPPISADSAAVGHPLKGHRSVYFKECGGCDELRDL